MPKFSDPNVLIGFDTSDDACVYRINDELALIQTVDFFPPIVDDPYLFGQIAAANALSDIYAMGASPTLAMNLLCIPSNLPPETVRAILAGGSDKVREAGAVIAGGHTIQDDVPKYGLCVSAFLHPNKVLANSGARPGDALVLTKPIGTGVLSTAMKAGLAKAEDFAAAVESMAMLNRVAGELIAQSGAHACTDITGFGLLGHLSELAGASGVSVRLFAERIPLLSGALELAGMGLLPAGAYANQEHLSGSVQFSDGIPRALRDLFFDPQTSGGLLAALPAQRADALAGSLQSQGVTACVIGEVLDAGEHSILVTL